MTPKLKKPDNELRPGAGFPPANSDWIDVSQTPGASWWTIAEDIRKKTGLRISAEELVYHNFKLKRGEAEYEAKVNYYLHHLVGCPIPANGKNFTFQGATIGRIYYPKMATGEGKHVIIVGGVSVNEAGHDKYPFNFIDMALRRGNGYGKNVEYIFFAPSYEMRVKHQKNEYFWINWNTRPLGPSDGCDKDSTWHKVFHAGHDRWEKDPSHFFIYVEKKAKLHGNVTPIRTANDLTAALNDVGRIASIDYFGHSDANSFFLDFGTDGTFRSKEMWGRKHAEGVLKHQFTPSALFSSFGCKQAQNGGLAPDLRDLWRIQTIGAEGKTDYAALSKDKKTMFPDAAGGYFLFPTPKGKGTAKKRKIEKTDLDRVVQSSDLAPE